MSQEAQITDPDAMETYLLGGHATATVVSKGTTRRFTYKVDARRVGRRRTSETEGEYDARKVDALKGVRFVKVMTGSDNERDFTYLGHIDEKGLFRLDRRSRLAETAPSVGAWQWFWGVLRARSEKIDQCEVWHDGKCARCGRSLTVPSSVASGLGPVCARNRSRA